MRSCDCNKSMADTADTIQALAAYFGVKCGKITYDGSERIPVMKGKTGTRKGFVTIAKHLARAAGKQHLCGETAEDKAVVDQWLEYKVCNLDKFRVEKDKIDPHLLKDLNTYLADKVYFLHHRLTLIDLVLYYTLHPTYVDLPLYDKQKFYHLSRWFNTVQHEATLRQFPLVIFAKTELYPSSAH